MQKGAAGRQIDQKHIDRDLGRILELHNFYHSRQASCKVLETIICLCQLGLCPEAEFRLSNQN